MIDIDGRCVPAFESLVMVELEAFQNGWYDVEIYAPLKFVYRCMSSFANDGRASAEIVDGMPIRLMHLNTMGRSLAHREARVLPVARVQFGVGGAGRVVRKELLEFGKAPGERKLAHLAPHLPPFDLRLVRTSRRSSLRRS